MSRTGEEIPRAVRVRIGGSVQGVGYRYFAVRAAESCGVTGFVRNLDDGSVEVRARGDREGLESFLDSLRIGPKTSGILEFDVLEIEDPEAFHGFGVRY
jgi:acylphosphatase